MTGNTLNHTSSRSITIQARSTVSIFDTFPKQRARLQRSMRKKMRKVIKLVVQGETRWYSHYRLMLSFDRAHSSLEY